MAHRGISEYIAKNLLAQNRQTSYAWHCISSPNDIQSFDKPWLWVIKPDQLVGKRWENGLLGIKLNAKQIRQRASDHWQKTITIWWHTWTLETFLIEPFISHTEERYLAIQTSREWDKVHFSQSWWIGIESRYDTIETVTILSSQKKEEEKNSILTQIKHWFPSMEWWIQDFVTEMIVMCRDYDWSYCEINPFTRDEQWTIHALDMVVKVDDCASYRQQNTRAQTNLPEPFWSTIHPISKKIATLDAKTGASLKCTMLNLQGKYWFILWWWWASVVVMDTMAAAWLASEIANYGEISGNADSENVFLYTDAILSAMKQTAPPQAVLCLVWWIANFSCIDNFANGVCQAFDHHRQRMQTHQISIIIRRGWINDVKWIQKIQTWCQKAMIPQKTISVDYDLSAFLM
jgi:succinyl-CoA synthetase beta subunit